MIPLLTLTCGLLLGGDPVVDSTCVQLAPLRANGKWLRRSDQTQAILLIHGYYFHLTDKNVGKPSFRPWQKADNPLVQELAKKADVFAFAYGQNATVATIVAKSKLRDSVAELRKLGYKELVLVGHSAGGLIARHYVEDYPDAGITRVVQVAAPNGGSPLADVRVPKSQRVFVECLTEQCREQSMKDRAQKMVPAKVQFVCIMARSEPNAQTDGVVPCRCQWTADLQKQGIPVFSMIGQHREVVHSGKHAESMARVIQTGHGRWNQEQVEKAKKELFGK